jgi:lysozyme
MGSDIRKSFSDWDPSSAIGFVKKFEGCRLCSYKDPVGVWTVGYGATRLASGNPVMRNVRITQEQADDLLKSELERLRAVLAQYIRVPVTEGQFVALIDFAYNCGEGALRRSTLLKLLNAGKVVNAGYEFRRWARAGGIELPGLVRRREAEKKIFLGEEEP